MDQTRKARLEAGGIMVDEALERFMGNEAMLERYLQTIGCEAMQELVILQERHIRAGEWKEAVGMMPEISNSYENICGVIRA